MDNDIKEVDVEEKKEEEIPFETFVVLSDGKKLTPDLTKMTIVDFRSLINTETSEDDGDIIMGKTLGWSKEKIQKLSYNDWRLLAGKILSACNQPPPTDSKKA